MRGSRYGTSIAGALHRVFIAPIEQSQFQCARRPAALLRPSSIPPFAQRRCYVQDATKKAEKSRLPRNHEITAWSIRLVNEDGSLGAPVNTRTTLSVLNPKTHNLVVVQPGEPGEPPICKIIDKKEMYAKEKAKKKANPAATTKTIELNWALDPNDLAHRIKRMKEFLGKGNKLEVVLAPKRRGRQATAEEAEALVDVIRESCAEVPGAKEGAAMSGKIGGAATLFFEGNLQKAEKQRKEAEKDKEKKIEA